MSCSRLVQVPSLSGPLRPQTTRRRRLGAPSSALYLQAVTHRRQSLHSLAHQPQGLHSFSLYSREAHPTAATSPISGCCPPFTPRLHFLPRSLYRALRTSRGGTSVYFKTCIDLLFLKRSTHAIPMVFSSVEPGPSPRASET